MESLGGWESPQSYHFHLIYVPTGVRMIREAISITKVSSSSHTCDNTLEISGSGRETPTMGQLG
jgi:hypothetical protein